MFSSFGGLIWGMWRKLKDGRGMDERVRRKGMRMQEVRGTCANLVQAVEFMG